MKGVLLDSCILIDALRNRRNRRAEIEGFLLRGLDVCSCAVTVAELRTGFRADERESTEEILSILRYRETSIVGAMMAGDWKKDWASRGRTLALPDLLIAATAFDHDLFVLTDNVKDFPMREIRVGSAVPSVH